MASSAALTTTHLPQLRVLLQQWEKKHPARGFSTPAHGGVPTAGKDVVVAFRTRPPLANEAAEKFAAGAEAEGDAPPEAVEFCAGISVASAEPGVVVAHVPGMKWNGPTLAHKSYEADLAFGPDVDNEEVYRRAVVANDLLPLVLSGGVGCILAYGQTGSGKTFTMEGLEHRIARDLFDAARVAGRRFRETERGTQDADAARDGDAIFEFQVTFLELLGKQAVDLVDPDATDAQGNRVRKDVAIREDKVGNVRPELVSTAVASSAELEALITQSLSHRRVSATLRNAASSRSHALLTIRIRNKLLPYAEEGQLILVDLAGSERYEDSKAHDKQRMDESRENNKTLMNLKECVRAKAKMAEEDGFVHVPWRSSKLTLLLKPIFDLESRQPSKTIIIAHVSPHIQDTVHSTNTLSYAAPFKTAPPKQRGPAPYDAADPRTWDHAQTVQFFAEQLAKYTREERAKAGRGDDETPVVDIAKLIPAGVTAVHFGKMYTSQFVEECLRHKLHDEAELVKVVAVQVIGQLFYLVMSAKTRKRNAIMKSRKKLAVGDTYGDSPVAEDEYDSEEFLEAQIYFGTQWKTRVIAADKKAREEGLQGDALQEARSRTVRELLREAKAAKARDEEDA